MLIKSLLMQFFATSSKEVSLDTPLAQTVHTFRFEGLFRSKFEYFTIADLGYLTLQSFFLWQYLCLVVFCLTRFIRRQSRRRVKRLVARTSLEVSPLYFTAERNVRSHHCTSWHFPSVSSPTLQLLLS